MLRLGAVPAMVAAIVICIGFWRGWFIVDRERIRDDTQRAIDKVEDVRDSILKKKQSE